MENLNYVNGEWFYHKDYAPEGKIFVQEDAETLESLAARGWVDDPSKIGVNVWGDADHIKKIVKKNQSDFENNLTPAIKDPRKSEPEHVRELMQKQAEQHAAEIKARDERIRELETGAQKVKRSKERLMDEKSDAKTLPKNAASKANKSGSADHA